MEFFMKVLVALAALATLIASPACAQTPWQGYRSSYGAYAQAPSQVFARPYVVTPRRPFAVYSTPNNYVGYDPDPSVRDQLARDPSQGD